MDKVNLDPVVYLEDDDDSGGSSASENFNDSFMLGKRDHVSIHGLEEVEPKRFKLSDHDENQHEHEERLVDMPMGLNNSPLPLGLSLKKTPSVLELITLQLRQLKNSVPPTNTVKELSKPRRGRPKKEEEKLSVHPTKMLEESSKPRRGRPRIGEEKLKAGSMTAKFLKIGSWERRAVLNQDLVAKCYYQQQKLVWEMLNGSLKRKMEIRWSDIIAIRAEFPQNSYAVLEIEVKTTPLFFQETPPQPRKQSSWIACSDFTGFQATQSRTHHLQFEEGILQPYYEKLLQCDERLRMLSTQTFSMHRTPPTSYFHPNVPGYQNYPPEFSSHQPSVVPMMQFTQYGYYHYHQAQMYQQRLHPSNPTYIAFPEAHGGNYNVDLQRMIKGGTVNLDNYYVANEYQPNPLVLDPVSSRNGLRRPPSSNFLLDDIANHLLNVPMSSSCPDEETLMARVESMNNLLGLSQEQAPINNNIDYLSDYENSHVESNETEEGSWLLESENWLPTMGVDDENIPLTHLERIPSLSAIFEALEAGELCNGMN